MCILNIGCAFVYICVLGVFALESNFLFFFFLTEQHFLLAILLAHAKLLPLCPAQVVGAARHPVWARLMLHIGPEDGNSCHTGETNRV